jgi:hypothetical protein
MRAGELTDQKTDAEAADEQALDAERKLHPELELARIACYDDLNTTAFQLSLQKLKPQEGEAYEFVVPGSYFAALPGNPPSAFLGVRCHGADLHDFSRRLLTFLHARNSRRDQPHGMVWRKLLGSLRYRSAGEVCVSPDLR